MLCRLSVIVCEWHWADVDKDKLAFPPSAAWSQLWFANMQTHTHGYTHTHLNLLDPDETFLTRQSQNPALKSQSPPTTRALRKSADIKDKRFAFMTSVPLSVCQCLRLSGLSEKAITSTPGSQ